MFLPTLLCREVFCHELHNLEVGKYQVLRKALNETYFSVFIKSLPPDDAPTLDRLTQAILKYLIESKLRNAMLFYKINITGYIEYVVAKIDSVFQISTDK